MHDDLRAAVAADMPRLKSRMQVEGTRQAVDAAMAQSIVAHQVRTFFGREPTAAEMTAAEAAGTECAQQTCQAEDFARPACFALLSSSEMLFY